MPKYMGLQSTRYYTQVLYLHFGHKNLMKYFFFIIIYDYAEIITIQLRIVYKVSYCKAFAIHKSYMVARFMTEWTNMVVNSNGQSINDRTIHSKNQKFYNTQLVPVTDENIRLLLYGINFGRIILSVHFDFAVQVQVSSSKIEKMLSSNCMLT